MGTAIQLEKECEAQLSANPFFAAIPVHVDPQKNVVQVVTEQISKTGMLVAPLVNRATVENPNAHGPLFEPVKIEVGVFQNPQFGSKFPAPRDVVEEVCSMRGLHLFQPLSIPSRVVCLGWEQAADKLLNIYSCHFEAKYGLGAPVLPQLPMPVWNPGAATLTCATPGAAVFYTIDGTRPAPRNGALALGALALLPGDTVKARAWLAGYLPSDILNFTT